VTGDSDRAGDVGGIVLEDGSNTAITVTGDTQVTCPFGVVCPVNGTQAQKDLWNTLGQPATWCNDCWLCGDVTSPYCEVTFGDVLQVFTYRDAEDPQGDVNMSGEVTFGDVLEVFTLRDAGGCDGDPAKCLPCTP
jgi:hypothetical protein